MIAIKNWFIVKNSLSGYRNRPLEIKKETEKAVLITTTNIYGDKLEHWFPKSVLTDEWEKDTSNFGYHSYLVETYRKAFAEENKGKVIKSGYNTYRWDAFTHQLTTKELINTLTTHDKPFMTRDEWNNREE